MTFKMHYKLQRQEKGKKGYIRTDKQTELQRHFLSCSSQLKMKFMLYSTLVEIVVKVEVELGNIIGVNVIFLFSPNSGHFGSFK